MLADRLDYVVGVDPHRDVHALAIVEVRTGGVVFEASVAANSSGYAAALELARAQRQGDERSRSRERAPSAPA
jgi:transposase